MAKRKSAGNTPAQLFREFARQQQTEKKQKALEEKATAEAERKRQEAESKRLEAEQRRTERAKEAQEARERAQNAKTVASALRGLDGREAQRARDEERAQREAVRQAEAAERKRKADEVEAKKQEAIDRTSEIDHVIKWINGGVLAERSRELAGYESTTSAAHEQSNGDTYAAAVTSALSDLKYLSNSPNAVQAAYEADSRRLKLLLDLPPQKRLPRERAFRYDSGRRDVVGVEWKPTETQTLYRRLIAAFVLCVLDYAAQVTSPDLVESIAVNAHVRATDRATGQKINPCLVTLLAERADLNQLVLDEPELDPVACLQHMKAAVSPHPYDLEPVRPIVEFDFSKFKLVEETGALGGLDHRTDLMELSSYDFERLVKRLAEAMGLKSWNTQPSKDGGVDAIAYNDTPFISGLCVIQAKRWSNTVTVESVRALFGTMQEKKATTGILVATSRFGKASYDFAKEVGRIELYDGPRLKSLLKEHLDMDVLIGPGQSSRRGNDS